MVSAWWGKRVDGAKGAVSGDEQQGIQKLGRDKSGHAKKKGQGRGAAGKLTDEGVLQSFFLIVPSYFSLILVVYLLGEVDVITPILLFFSFAPYLPFASLTLLWT